MPKSNFLVGQTINDFEILALIGEGAFSQVFEAKNAKTAELRALKVLRLNPGIEQIREFENEGNLLEKLEKSDHVVKMFGRDLATIMVEHVPSGTSLPIEVRFLILERADGCLQDVVAELKTVPYVERLRLFRDVVHGVHNMHLNDVVHRDIKSSNCLLFEKRFRSIVAKVSDLGRSRDLADLGMATVLQYQFGRGDPNFAPPEMLWQLGTDTALGHRCADLYGLGSLLYELTTGHGISAVALFPRYPDIKSDLALPEGERKKQYAARHNEIRTWFETALLLAGAEIPPSARQEILKLLKQLSDPAPMNRLPKVIPGRTAYVTPDLNWLLQKVDSLVKLIDISNEKQVRALSRRVQ